MNRNAKRVQQRVHRAWNNAIHRLQQMNQASTVQPPLPFDIFKLDEHGPDDVVKLTVGPVVFNVHKRPNKRAANLFIVLKGWLAFDGPDFETPPLKTKNFGTQVAYFRSKESDHTLEHIYGAHYDMDEEKFGHPVFHSQLGSHLEFGNDINCLFRLDYQLVNRMDKILRTVRTPSAQMDVFSVVTQICADHLVDKNSDPGVKTAFQKVREACDFLVGAAHRMAFLNVKPATCCYRSTHWYRRQTQ